MGELLTSVAAWFIFTAVSNFFYIISCNNDTLYIDPDTSRIICIVIALIRNLLNLGIMLFYANVKYKEERAPENMEKIDPDALIQVEDALMDECATTFFIAFLNDRQQKDGIRLIKAYTSIKKYEDFAKNSANISEILQLGKDTWVKVEKWAIQKYTRQVYNEDSLSKIHNDLYISQNCDVHLFDHVFGVVVNVLQKMFNNFRDSRFYTMLRKKQETRSIIIDRMKNVKLI